MLLALSSGDGNGVGVASGVGVGVASGVGVGVGVGVGGASPASVGPLSAITMAMAPSRAPSQLTLVDRVLHTATRPTILSPRDGRQRYPRTDLLGQPLFAVAAAQFRDDV